MFKIQKLNCFLIMLMLVLSFLPLLDYEKFDQIVIILTSLILILLSVLNFHFFSKANIFLLFLNALSIAGTLFSHSGFGAGLLIFNLLLAFSVFKNITISLRMYKYIHLVAAIGLCAYLFSLESSSLYSGHVVAFNNNIINSNMVGTLALAAFMHVVCYLSVKNLTKRKIIMLTVILLFLFSSIMSGSQSRSAMLSLLFFVFFEFLKKSEINEKTYKNTLLVILISSLIFPFIYLALYNVLGDNPILFGKSLFSGRQYVWSSLLEQLVNFIFMGSGTDYLMMSVNGSWTHSSHNMLLGVWKMFGLIPTMSIIGQLYSAPTVRVGKVLKTSQLAILCSMPLAFFESFLTESRIYIFFLMFFINHVEANKQEI